MAEHDAEAGMVAGDTLTWRLSSSICCRASVSALSASFLADASDSAAACTAFKGLASQRNGRCKSLFSRRGRGELLMGTIDCHCLQGQVTILG